MKPQTESSITRRKFLVATGAAAGGVASRSFAQVKSDQAGSSPSRAASAKKKDPNARPMMKIAEIFGPPENRLWRLVKQCGTDHVVGTFSFGWDKERPGYSTIGRLFAVGYIRGLIQCVHSE